MNRVAQILAISFAAVLSINGERVTIATAIAVATALVALAGVVVTVFGIWVAIIFPKLLGSLEGGAPSNDTPEKARFDSLISALYRSCFVLCASAFVFLLLSFYGFQSAYLMLSVVFFCWLSFASIVFSLWTAVVTGEMAAGHGINVALRKGALSRIRAGGRHRKKVG